MLTDICLITHNYKPKKSKDKCLSGIHTPQSSEVDFCANDGAKDQRDGSVCRTTDAGEGKETYRDRSVSVEKLQLHK